MLFDFYCYPTFFRVNFYILTQCGILIHLRLVCMVNGSVGNVFQEAKGTREQCLREERSAIRQCTFQNLNDGRDLGEIMVSIYKVI